jgi:hypothetical protein
VECTTVVFDCHGNVKSYEARRWKPNSHQGQTDKDNTEELHCNVRVVTKTRLATDDLCETPPGVKVLLQKPFAFSGVLYTVSCLHKSIGTLGFGKRSSSWVTSNVD